MTISVLPANIAPLSQRARRFCALTVGTALVLISPSGATAQPAALPRRSGSSRSNMGR